MQLSTPRRHPSPRFVHCWHAGGSLPHTDASRRHTLPESGGGLQRSSGRRCAAPKPSERQRKPRDGQMRRYNSVAACGCCRCCWWWCAWLWPFHGVHHLGWVGRVAFEGNEAARRRSTPAGRACPRCCQAPHASRRSCREFGCLPARVDGPAVCR